MTSQPDLRPVRVAWTAGLVVLCRDCDGSDAKRLRKALKKRLPKTVRVVESSCLDVCPKRATAGCIFARATGTSFPILVAPETDLDACAADIAFRCSVPGEPS